MQLFRGGLVFKAHRLCVPLSSRLESNKEEEADLVVLGESHAEHSMKAKFIVNLPDTRYKT